MGCVGYAWLKSQHETMRVSVLIPVYDDVRLEACLGSIVPQARYRYRDDVEIIVIDNGSRDEVAKICDRFAESVVYLREPRVGSYAARNAGLRIARGDLYAFTDADCLPSPNWLHTGRRAFEDGDAQVLTGPVQLVAGDPDRPNLVELNQICTGFQVRRYVDDQCFGPTANLWTLASVVKKVGPFDERLRSSGDVEWCQRARGSGYPTRYCEDLIVRHPARANLRAATLVSRRLTGGHVMLALREKQLSELMRRRLWPHQAIRSIVSSSRFTWTQRGRALVVELWLYFVRLAELGRLLLGGEPLR
jgi:glycosyltransferase involved in cell wall biosynthesis